MAKLKIVNMNNWNKARKRFLCLDCKVDTRITGENYMLRESIWLKANPADAGRLCINCLEKRLGRPLTRRDFIIGETTNKIAVFHNKKIARILHFNESEYSDAAEVHWQWCAGACPFCAEITW